MGNHELAIVQPRYQTLINPNARIKVGSVGQPRDSDNRAKYVIWDSSSRQFDVRYIAYDIAKTAYRTLELGFPEFDARRLW